MGEFLSLLGGSLGGTIVGSLAAAFTRWQEAKTKLKERHLDLQEVKLMNDHEEKLMALKIESVTKEMEYKGLTESIQSDKATYSAGSTNPWLIMVDVIRGLVRPILTATLLVYMMWTMFFLTRTYNVAFTETQVYSLVEMIVHDLVVSSSLALSWWFGSRPQRG